MRTTNQIEVLNDLMQMAEAQLAVYKVAIPAVKTGSDSFLVFSSLADKKTKHITELREEIKKVGGRLPDVLLKLAGEQSSITFPNALELVTCGESGEKALVKAYENALKNPDLNSAQRFTLRTQYQELLSGIDKLRSLGQFDYKQSSAPHVFSSGKVLPEVNFLQ